MLNQIFIYMGKTVQRESIWQDVDGIRIPEIWEGLLIKERNRWGILYGLKRIFERVAEYFCKKKTEVKEEEAAEEGNPFLPRLREILEKILEIYGMEYRTFCPLLLDTDTLPESMLDEDDVELVLEQISTDLNFLKIATNRPAYFAPYIERMYEDTGLVVQLEEDEEVSLEGVNVIIDMERKGNCYYRYMKEGVLYIPVYKRPWSYVKMLENLDISVPIGYNTVIVKGR